MPIRERPSTLPMSSLPTLEKALHFGRITRLDKTRVRAALAMADRANVIDIRRVTTLVLDRVSQYYEILGYCAPRASLSTSESELPRAVSAESEAVSSDGGRPMHARVGLETDLTEENVDRLWKMAGLISLNLAFNMAEWEITRCAPESGTIVSVARKFAAWVVPNPARKIPGSFSPRSSHQPSRMPRPSCSGTDAHSSTASCNGTPSPVDRQQMNGTLVDATTPSNSRPLTHI